MAGLKKTDRANAYLDQILEYDSSERSKIVLRESIRRSGNDQVMEHFNLATI